MVLKHKRGWVRRVISRIKNARIIFSSAAAGGLYSGGDCIAQNLEWHYGVESHGKVEFNYDRTMRMGFFGLFLGGPLMHVWYSQLHIMTGVYRFRYVPLATGQGTKIPFITAITQGFRREKLESAKDRITQVATKVVLDQLFFQAQFLNFYLFTMSMLEGHGVEEAIGKCKKGFHDAWAYAICFWIPAQTMNFLFVAPRHHALVVNVVNVMWQTFLSLLFHSRDYGARDDKMQDEKVDSVVAKAPNKNIELARDDFVGDIAPVVVDVSAQEAELTKDLIRLLVSQQAEMQKQIQEFTRDEISRSQAREQQVVALESAINAQAEQLSGLVSRLQT